MKILKAILLLVMVAGTFTVHGQNIDFNPKFSAFGGKKEQKEIKRVYICEFVVEQMLRKKGMAKAGGGLTGNMSFAHMTVDFGGVDPATYQQLVTDLYNVAVEKFKAAGYEVVTGEEAKAKTNKELKTYEVGKPESSRFLEHYIALRPKDQLLYVNSSVFAGNAFSNLSKDLNAIVFQFAFPVDYVAYEVTRGGAFSTKAEIEAKPYLAISGSAIASVPKGGATIVLYPAKAPNDWVGPGGFTKTDGKYPNVYAEAAHSKYVVDIDEPKFFEYVRTYLTAAINSSIDTFLKKAVND
ncbi:MAG TPA: hypothetical protein VHA56_09710 [Mucilaginibacter sp.]|nr:hypothetical protein [Mucilaginibacter sp.]